MGTLAKPTDNTDLVAVLKLTSETFADWTDRKADFGAAAKDAYGQTGLNLEELTEKLRKDQLIEDLEKLILANNGPFETWPEQAQAAAKNALSVAGRVPEGAERLVVDFITIMNLAREGSGPLLNKLMEIKYGAALAFQVRAMSNRPVEQMRLSSFYNSLTGVSWENNDVLKAYIEKLQERSAS